MGYMERDYLRNTEVPDEAAGVDAEAAASYPDDGAKKINEGGYAQQKIFSAKETAFYWKKVPSGTFIARGEKSPTWLQGCKVSADSLVRG